MRVSWRRNNSDISQLLLWDSTTRTHLHISYGRMSWTVVFWGAQWFRSPTVMAFPLTSTPYSPAQAVGSLGTEEWVYWGSSLYWLIRDGTSQKVNSTMNQVESWGICCCSICLSEQKIKVIYLAKPDVYIFIPRKLFNSDSVVCTHIPISKILQTCICILFYFKGSV